MEITVDQKKINTKALNGIDLCRELNKTDPSDALALKINDDLVNLNASINDGDIVEIISFSDSIGKQIFWHTSAHVLAQAVKRLFPEAIATIGPSIQNGFYYDFANLTISEEDLSKIEKEAKKIIKENPKIEKIVFPSKEEALQAFDYNPYKKELIEEFENQISAYRQGEFLDLCKGPHLPTLSKIKAFKILKTSGAYWRGDSKNEMLTRIYGISFPDKKNAFRLFIFTRRGKKTGS